MATSTSDQLVVHGWQLFAHPLFLGQVETLMAAVERARAKGPKGSSNTANAKVLSALLKLVFEIVPSDPTRAEYRQGGTLDRDRRHWFRAKFGGQRFRLLFRFDTKAKIIIFAWVNDQNTLQTYGSRSDAYAVFRAMLDKGNPPDDWNALVAAATHPDMAARLGAIGRDDMP